MTLVLTAKTRSRPPALGAAQLAWEQLNSSKYRTPNNCQLCTCPRTDAPKTFVLKLSPSFQLQNSAFRHSSSCARMLYFNADPAPKPVVWFGTPYSCSRLGISTVLHHGHDTSHPSFELKVFASAQNVMQHRAQTLPCLPRGQRPPTSRHLDRQALTSS